MSKSLKNFVSIDALLEKYDANTIRFFILTNHYRMPVEFNDESLASAQAGLKRLKTAVIEAVKIVGELDFVVDVSSCEINEFKTAMDDDFNTSKALAVLFDLAGKVNKAISANDKPEVSKYLFVLKTLMNVLGFKVEKEELSEEELTSRLETVKEQMDFLSQDDKGLSGVELMGKIIEIRNNARKYKNWAVADKIRNIFDSINIVLKDSKDFTTWEEK
jgi:cysteinyl-tRNA synthetase